MLTKFDFKSDALYIDGGRFVTRAEAMNYLCMSKSSFYRNVQNGLVPRPRYIGKTPVWRLDDLRAIFNQLPTSPGYAAASSESR